MPGAVWKLNTFGDDDLGATTDTSIYAKFRIDLSVYRHCGREPSYKCSYAGIQSARALTTRFQRFTVATDYHARKTWEKRCGP